MSIAHGPRLEPRLPWTFAKGLLALLLLIGLVGGLVGAITYGLARLVTTALGIPG